MPGVDVDLGDVDRFSQIDQQSAAVRVLSEEEVLFRLILLGGELADLLDRDFSVALDV